MPKVCPKQFSTVSYSCTVCVITVSGTFRRPGVVWNNFYCFQSIGSIHYEISQFQCSTGNLMKTFYMFWRYQVQPLLDKPRSGSRAGPAQTNRGGREPWEPWSLCENPDAWIDAAASETNRDSRDKHQRGRRRFEAVALELIAFCASIPDEHSRRVLTLCSIRSSPFVVASHSSY